MEKHDKVSGIFGFLFGGFIIYSAFTLDIGALGDPGAGFFPLVAGCGLCLMSAMIYLQAVLSKGKKTERIFSGVIWRRPAVILVAVFLYILFLENWVLFSSTFSYWLSFSRRLNHSGGVWRSSPPLWSPWLLGPFLRTGLNVNFQQEFSACLECEFSVER